MITLKEELKKTSKFRAEIYTFFSRIYREELDKALLRSIKKKIKQIDIKDPEVARGYGELRKVVNQLEINEKTVEELAADYASLFLGIGRKPAHPYESVYLSKDKIVMREPWREILRTYQKEGLAKANDVKEPEDHVALELEFMARLCQKMEKALDKSDVFEVLRVLDVQDKFLTNHLGVWTTKFCKEIVEGSSKFNFYRAIAMITRRFITLEKEHVIKLKEELLGTHKVSE